MKKRLLLITDGFPFGNSERGFLPAEVNVLVKNFDVHILARGKAQPLLYPVEGLKSVSRFDTGPFRENLCPRLVMGLLRPRVWKEVTYALKDRGIHGLKGRVRSILQYTYGAWLAQQKLREIVQRERIDIIYSYWCTPVTLGAVWLKQEFPHLKVITRLHRYDLYEAQFSADYQPFRREIAEKIDRLIFISKEGQEYFLTRWGQEWRSKCHLAYLGCRSMPRVSSKEDGVLRIVSCSNVIPVKRVHLIVEALALLDEELAVEWHHFGDGSEMANISKLAEQKLSNKKHLQWKLWGFVQNHELDAQYGAICPDLFLTTSASEGLPVSIQEAFAMGIPTIATNVGGMAELVIDGKTGCLMEQNPDSRRIAETITRFAKLPPAQRKAMSDAAHSLWSEQFNAQQNAERFASFLQQL